MSTAGSKPQNSTFTKQFVAKSGAAFVKGVGVVVDAVASDGTVTVDVAASGEQCIAIADESLTGDGTTKIQCVLLNGGTARVKASSTCTAGLYGEAGSGGFQNRTLGGGTTVRYIAGQFLESGVSGDFVEMALCGFAGVSA